MPEMKKRQPSVCAHLKAQPSTVVPDEPSTSSPELHSAPDLMSVALHSTHAEQALVPQPQRSFHGSSWPAHHSKQHPMSLQLLHSAHPEQVFSSQPQRSFHGSEWVEHQSSHLAVDAGHAAPSSRSQQSVEPHGATRLLPFLALQVLTPQRALGNVPEILL